MFKIKLIYLSIILNCATTVIYEQNNLPQKLTEDQKIELLIKSIEQIPDAKFYRNGTWHTPQAAASHLHLKWEKAKGRVKTAEQFIKYLASGSSVSGKKYKIMFSNGQVIDSELFFKNKLNELEKQNITKP